MGGLGRRAWLSSCAAIVAWRFKAGGPVVAAQDLCKPPKLPFKLNFGGWNGAAANASVVPTVQGCGNGG
jgi:hypothetical protein